MTKRFAVVNPETGLVENIIRAGAGFVIPGRALIETADAAPGWTYDGASFVAPEPEPESEHEPSETDVRLAAIEEKLGITRADIDSAKIALKEKMKR